MIERYRASGPDGAVAFSADSSDQRPLAEIARHALAARLGVAPEFLAITFTAIAPINDAARAIVPEPRV